MESTTTSTNNKGVKVLLHLPQVTECWMLVCDLRVNSDKFIAFGILGLYRQRAWLGLGQRISVYWEANPAVDGNVGYIGYVYKHYIGGGFF